MGVFDYFVIYGAMRTGSNFLEVNLDEYDGLACYGEAFNPHFVGYARKDEMCGITLAEREADPMRLIRAMRDKTDGIPGFRFFHDHDPRMLELTLADRRCAKIMLTRNPLDSYISRKIAAATGQWKLGNEKHRKTAKIRFEPDEFEDHVTALQAFQHKLLRTIQSSGQTAFFVTYDDLQDVEVLNGLARWLGARGTKARPSDTIKKQNPAGLEEKVENLDEMHAALSRYDRFDLDRTPNLEPRRGPAVPGYLAGAAAPLLYMPVRGACDLEVAEWLSVIGDGLAPAFTQKTLRQWKRQNPAHRSFTVVAHPLERAHRAFVRHILMPGPDAFGEMRATLRKLHDVDIPLDGPGSGYGAARHRKAFGAFLDFLKLNLGGQTSLRVDPAWASQISILQGFAAFGLPDMVLRDYALADGLAQLAAQIGLPSPDLAIVADDGPHALATIYDADLEARAKDIYTRDYMMFGFGPWKPL